MTTPEPRDDVVATLMRLRAEHVTGMIAPSQLYADRDRWSSAEEQALAFRAVESRSPAEAAVLPDRITRFKAEADQERARLRNLGHADEHPWRLREIGDEGAAD